MTYSHMAIRPHYHRRRAFSLPSSEWDRVVPARYDRQAKRSPAPLIALAAQACLENVETRYVSHPRSLRLLGCYMVKPHGQLVLVS